MLEDVAINYLSVLGAAVASMIVGMAWYSPLLFGKKWMQLSGVSQEECEKAKKKGMATIYLAGFANCLVMSLVLAFFMDRTGVVTLMDALIVAIAAWLGFMATLLMSAVLWEKKPVGLFLIGAGYYLVVLLVAGTLLSLFP